MYRFALGQLLFVEASRSKGCGKLTVTGQLGEVMLESVRTAMLGDPSVSKFLLDSSWKLLMLVEPCCLCRQIMVKLPTHSTHFKSILRTFLVIILWNSRLIVPSPIYGCPIKVPPPQPHLLRGLGQRAASGGGCATNADEASWFPLNMLSWIDFSLKTSLIVD